MRLVILVCCLFFRTRKKKLSNYHRYSLNKPEWCKNHMIRTNLKASHTLLRRSRRTAKIEQLKIGFLFVTNLNLITFSRRQFCILKFVAISVPLTLSLQPPLSSEFCETWAHRFNMFDFVSIKFAFRLTTAQRSDNNDVIISEWTCSPTNLCFRRYVCSASIDSHWTRWFIDSACSHSLSGQMDNEYLNFFIFDFLRSMYVT